MTVSVFVARDCVYLTISRLPFTRTCNCYVTRSSSSTAYFLKRRKKIPACRTANSDRDQNELNTAGDNFVLEEDFSTKQYKESNLKTLFERFWKVAIPYWISDDKIQATLRLASVVALTLATTGISVGFNFIGRDFYNALASKDQEQFTKQLLYYLGAFAGGIPVFVLRDYAKDTLALRWRAWMTKNYLDRYFESRTFYTIQSQSLIDNPDQRIVDDVSAFTSSALSFSLTLFTALVDLISFSNILFGIYPPLFAVLVAYSLGGTAISVLIGKGLVNLNFMQEKKEADFRYGLVRIRENSESIAFYGGEKNEKEMLMQRFKEAFENLTQLLISSRNLDFFTSGYRYLIQILPAAVVAPMYFSGKIEFGIINQSYSAFNHVLGDFSLIVYQFQALSSFSAVIDRLGEFGDTLEQNVPQLSEKSKPRISLLMIGQSSMAFQDSKGATDTGYPQKLLEIEHLTLYTPNYTMALIHDLSFAFRQGEHILIMGPSGTGKTSLLRAVAGLWSSGEGTIKFWIQKSSKLFQSFTQNGQVANIDRQGADMFQQNLVGPRKCHEGMFFLPQRPYMVLGTLRQQLLYPTWTENTYDNEKSTSSLPLSMQNLNPRSTLELESIPTKEQLVEILKTVSLDHLLTRYNGLDNIVDWSSVLSLGEQQRLAFARLLLARPKLALLDECTSALDEINEAHLYQEIAGAGITYVSIGHRSTLRKYHKKVLHLTKMHMQKRNWAIEPIVQGIEHLVKSAA